MNDHSIPSMHTERKITNLSVKTLLLYIPLLALTDGQTESLTEGQIHLLRVGWRNFFSSFAVVSVFGSGGKKVLVLHTYVLRVQ